MSRSTQARPNSTGPSEHQWTSEQTYNLLDHILSNPKYTQNFFPTPGHTPAPGIIKRYARTICMIVLKDRAWTECMKEKHEGGKLKFARNDPVTIRLKELREMAVHYEERLGGYTRYEDIPDGSEYAKRWRKYERCSERKWVLKYLALKRIQADNSIMLEPDSLMEAGPSINIPAPSNEEDVEGSGQGSAQNNGSGSRKRASLRPDDPHLISKRRRSSMNGQETIKQSSVWSSDPDKEKVIIVISDSEDDDTIPIRSISHHTKRAPSPTFVDSDSDADSEDDDSIRSVSPPIITLPSRSFALPPPDSPYNATIASPVRLAFQAPIDDTPTDSEDEDIDAPSRAGRGIDIFSSISLTTNEDLIGMFTDPNLRPQQAWRNGLPTPPDSRGSGSTSPIKPAGRGWDSAMTPEPAMRARTVSKKDMDIEANLDHDGEGLEPDRPTTPPLPNATPAPDTDHVIQEHRNIGQTSSERPRTPSFTILPNDRPITPPLPSQLIEQPIQPRSRSAPDMTDIEDIHHNPTDAEREIAARLLRTLTSDQTSQEEDITTTPVDQYPQLLAHEEKSTNVLAHWIVSHTGTSHDTTGSVPLERGRERRPLLDRMAPGICKGKGKGKEVEAPRQNPNSYIDEAYIEEASSTAVDTSKTNSTSTIQPGSARPSATSPINATSIHQATFRVSSSILDILIGKNHSTSPLHLSGHVIAFAPGHIPFRPKLAELVVALGGIVLEECQVRVLRGRRYIVHPIGEGRGDLGDDLEEVDVLGFLGIVGSKIGGSAYGQRPSLQATLSTGLQPPLHRGV